jgi:hypothetical protein
VKRAHPLLGLSLLAAPAAAQQDSAGPPRVRAVVDTVAAQDVIYNRPYIVSLGKTSLGGYVEANGQYFKEDGVSEGVQLELRRFNLFFFSAIGTRIRFTGELEFEDGAETIRIETALVDVIINPSLVLRGGVLLPPIGLFNVRHDSPLWDVIDRPLVSTEIIPSTLSEPGFGAHGRFFPHGFTLTYDAYLTTGLQEDVILNDFGRTRLASGKTAAIFAGDANGSLAVSTRIAAQQRQLGEVGLSYYGGAYNIYRVEGFHVDERRDVRILAVDLNTVVLGTSIRGEFAQAWIEVPEDLRQVFGQRQWGFFVDVVRPFLRPRLLGWNAALEAVVRLEAVDYNSGTFDITGESIGDEVQAVTFGLAFRPVAGTVLMLNFRRSWIHDLAGNAPINRGGFQLGFATYF